jgi:hypothetical protein
LEIQRQVFVINYAATVKIAGELDRYCGLDRYNNRSELHCG